MTKPKIPGVNLALRRGADHPRWKGGCAMHAKGYRLVSSPGHPRADSKGRVLEHVLVAERALGKPLPRGAEVHHVDENPANNASANLVICPDTGYHKLLHRRARAFALCGDPSARWCSYCKSYGNQDDIRGGRKPGEKTYHNSCAVEFRRTRRRYLSGAK